MSSSISCFVNVNEKGSPLPLRTRAVAAQEPSSFQRAICEAVQRQAIALRRCVEALESAEETGGARGFRAASTPRRPAPRARCTNASAQRRRLRGRTHARAVRHAAEREARNDQLCA